MKIEFAIFRYFPHGGVQRDMRLMAEELVRRGHEVTICAAEWQGPVPAGIELCRIAVKGWSNHARVRNFAAALERRPRCGLRVGFTRLPGLDVYFAGDNCFALGAARKPRWQRWLTRRYAVFEALERAVCAPEAGTEILYLAPRQKNEYQQFYHTPEARFHQLPPGIDPDRRRPEEAVAQRIRAAKRAELGIDATELLVLSVGSGFRTKGVDRTLTALAGVPAAARSRLRCLIAGRPGSGGWAALARRLGVAEQVIWGGGA